MQGAVSDALGCPLLLIIFLETLKDGNKCHFLKIEYNPLENHWLSLQNSMNQKGSNWKKIPTLNFSYRLIAL